MTYDAAGNLFNDTYTGAGNRVFDAENRMTSAWGGSNQWQYYTYNADGQRVRRKVDGDETWQIYGMDGELLAEYAANGATSAPQKEYGYRNGQLLVTAEPAPTNVALTSNGGTASASSTYVNPPYSYPVSAVINGDRKGLNAGFGGNWAASPPLPQWVQVDFNGNKTISEVDVFSLQDNYGSPIEPTETTTFSLYGLTAFDVQYWNGSSWVTAPGGSVTGNNKVWKKITFDPVKTSKIRVVIAATVDTWTRVVEVEAWTASNGTQWLVTDHLGTPRMVIDKTGALANVKRHDYLPFGEEIPANTGGRLPSYGYIFGDGVRQKFTAKERDSETGLDWSATRYYTYTGGRFTSPDSYNIIIEKDKGRDESERMHFFMSYASQPQIWNRYAYVVNNPLKLSDPDGRRPVTAEDEARLKKLHDWVYARAAELANDNQAAAAQSLREAGDAAGREIRQAIIEAPADEGEGGPQATPGNPAGLGAVFYVIDHLGDMSFATGPNAGSMSYTNNGWNVFVGQKDYKCNFFVGIALAAGGRIGLGGSGVPVNGTKGGLGAIWGNGNFPTANEWASGSVANFGRVSAPAVGDVAAWGARIGHGHLAIVLGGGLVGYGNEIAGVKVQTTAYVTADRNSAPSYFRYKP